jgi:predicted nucleotidyltransferase component of viral defense system
VEQFGVSIDSLLDIAVNKLFTIYQRTAARDYIDLYVLVQERGYSIADLLKQAKIKFDWHIDPLQLGTQFLKADEAQDYPRLIQDIDPKKWQDFFRNEADKLKPQILK